MIDADAISGIDKNDQGGAPSQMGTCINFEEEIKVSSQSGLY